MICDVWDIYSVIMKLMRGSLPMWLVKICSSSSCEWTACLCQCQAWKGLYTGWLVRLEWESCHDPINELDFMAVILAFKTNLTENLSTNSSWNVKEHLALSGGNSQYEQQKRLSCVRGSSSRAVAVPAAGLPWHWHSRGTADVPAGDRNRRGTRQTSSSCAVCF